MAKKKSVAKMPEGMDLLDPLAQARYLALQNKEGTVMQSSKLDDGIRYLEVPDLAYQYALGRPGYAMGRIQNLIGFEGSSKTSKQLWLANQVFLQGGLAHAVFVEHADTTYHIQQYIRNSQHLDNFMCWICNTLEEAIKAVYQILDIFEQIDPQKKLLKAVIFDSIAGATQQKLMEEDAVEGAPTPGGIGKVMADFINIAKVRFAETGTLGLFNNQARDAQDIGRFGGNKPEIEKLVAKGGRALPFHATYFEVVKRMGALKVDDSTAKFGKSIEGFEANLTFKKNKLGVPFRSVNFDVIWNVGIDFCRHTMPFLEMGNFCGLKSRSGGSKGKLFFSDDMGISSSQAIPTREMYDLIHSAEFKHMFQKELGIIVDSREAIEKTSPSIAPSAPSPAVITPPKPPTIPPSPPESPVIPPSLPVSEGSTQQSSLPPT